MCVFTVQYDCLCAGLPQLHVAHYPWARCSLEEGFRAAEETVVQRTGECSDTRGGEADGDRLADLVTFTCRDGAEGVFVLERRASSCPTGSLTRQQTSNTASLASMPGPLLWNMNAELCFCWQPHDCSGGEKMLSVLKPRLAYSKLLSSVFVADSASNSMDCVSWPYALIYCRACLAQYLTSHQCQ